MATATATDSSPPGVMPDLKLLSGKELIEHGVNTNGPLPTRNPKEIIAADTVAEKEQIEAMLNARKELIATPRIEKRGTMSQGEWKEAIQKVFVTDQKGGYWSFMGHKVDGQTYLYPEEAVFLMEINTLLLKHDGVPVSVQQAYSVLLGETITLDEYRAYSHFMKEGYKLLRHEDGRKYCTIEETEIGGIQVDTSKTESTVIDLNGSKSDSNNVDMTKHIDSPKEVKASNEIITEDNSNDCFVIVDKDLIPSKRKLSECEESNRKKMKENDENVNFNNKILHNEETPKILESIIDCHGKNLVYIECPDSLYLPHNVAPKKSFYFYKVEKEKESKITEANNDKSLTPSKSNANSSNTYSNSALFVNHIYQNISIDQSGFGMKVERSSSLIYFENVQSTNAEKSETKSPKDKKEKSSDVPPTPAKKELFNPFSNPDLVKGADQPKDTTPAFMIRKNKLNPNPFSSMFSTSHTKRQQRVSEIKKQIFQLLVNNENVAFDDKGDEELLGCNALNRYKRLVAKSKKYLRMNMLCKNKLVRIKVNAYLETIVEKFNECFDSNVIINKDAKLGEPPIIELPPENANVVQLSSDSDELDNNSDEKAVVEVESNDDAECKNAIDKWYGENSWNRPELPRLNSTKHDGRLAKLSSSFFAGVKNLNLENANIKSWSDLKAHWNRLAIQNVVSISDDEDEGKEVSKSTDTTSKTMVDSNPEGENDEVPKPDSIPKLKISYDIYKPNCKAFRKSNPPPPSSVLVIRCVDSEFLSSDDLDDVRRRIPENTLIWVAVVSIDNVFIMEMDNVELPTIQRENVTDESYIN